MQAAEVVADMQVAVAVVQLDLVVQVAVVQEQQEQLQQPPEPQTLAEVAAGLAAELPVMMDLAQVADQVL